MRYFVFPAYILSLAVWPGDLHAQEVGGNDSIHQPKPVVRWTFDDGPAPGPRAPTYPAFDVKNTAGYSKGPGALLRVDSSDPILTALTFDRRAEITLEAWVKVESLRDGTYAYIVGKGRTGGEMNQNYALRVKGEGGRVKLNFLYSSAPLADQPAGWHRWTSSKSFVTGSWHHIAITHVFRKKDRLMGYIDGQPVDGVWDMDGATDREPSVDDDALLIGTGNDDGTGKNRSNLFLGWIDEVAIWNEVLEPEVIGTRYQYEAPPPMVVRSSLKPNEVAVQICEEGIPSAATAWPDFPVAATETYVEPAFAFFEMPERYVAGGVRGQRANPFLLRAAAVVHLPAGKHRLLLRSRGGARLYIDDELILTTPFNRRNQSGHGKVSQQVDYLDLGPDFRFAPPGNAEKTCEFTSKGGEHLIVMETLVGGMIGKKPRRATLGETVVAWSQEGTESWQLLSPGKSTLAYTDKAWEAYAAQRREHYAKSNAETRAGLREKNSIYWASRREAAQQWLAATPEVVPPSMPEGYPAFNAIDHFLAVKMEEVKATLTGKKSGGVDYHEQIEPILAAKCYDCHQGGKAKGGLRLDELSAALSGGEEDGPAVVPGTPERSSLMHRITTDDEDLLMPPKGEPVTEEEAALLRQWIEEGAVWPSLKVKDVRLTPLSDDLTFLRRIHLDIVGVPPSLEEIAEFKLNPDRSAWIDRLLKDPRWADNWTGYWQDVLAENPNILNPTLNNSGPFRWWIHESLLDNKPLDLFVTELVKMEGSSYAGGPAGFALATENDVPMAEKGIIVGAAFLGVEMKCARCHDAPAHEYTQEQLFQLAAMLGVGPIQVPKTSSVPMDQFHENGRKALIQVTLQPGTTVSPAWPFKDLCDEATAMQMAADPKNPRDLLAAMITAPQNERFAQVMVNRLWTRWMGRGIVEKVGDWERAKPTHPELLKWLGRELVRGGYDSKHIARLIFNSHAYQRQTDPALRTPSPVYAAPVPRRLDAEQIVDSLFFAAGKPFRTEEASLDIDGVRTIDSSISLGHPTRSWMLISTSNERDRPSLSLPRIQAVADVLSAFGWRGARQDATTVRDSEANALQPAILSNGMVGTWLSVLSDDHAVTKMAIEAESPEALIDTLFLRLLTRSPTQEERETLMNHIRSGFAERLQEPVPLPVSNRAPPKYVSWSNHLDGEATTVRMQQEADARRGDPPTERLASDWRIRMEDALWTILNAPDWIFAP